MPKKKLTAREYLGQLEAQLDERKGKTKKAKADRALLMAEVAELRGVVRDAEIGEGKRRRPTG